MEHAPLQQRQTTGFKLTQHLPSYAQSARPGDTFSLAIHSLPGCLAHERGRKPSLWNEELFWSVPGQVSPAGTGRPRLGETSGNEG